jgi:oligo-1,6-glucosidase
LHLFAEKQPDLNWDNPKVRHEVYDLMKFWLDKGADGFRMDVIPFISKDQSFPDFPPDYDGNYGKVYASGPKLHEYIQEMNREVLSKYDVMTVGEAAGTTLEQTPMLVDERRKELNMIFQFDVVSIDRNGWRWKPWTWPAVKAIYTRYEKALDTHSWNTVFLTNHDNTRVVTRFGDDSPQFRLPSAKALATMLLTMKGTPFMYQGDELGMTNYPFTKIEEFDDIQVKNAYKAEILTGQAGIAEYIENLRKTSRDHSRTPMQWDESVNGGFTTGPKAWLTVNPNYKEINARQAVADPNSIYNYFKKMIELRKKTPALIYGDYKDLDPQNPTIFAYTRVMGADKYLVVLNLSKNDVAYILPEGLKAGQLKLSNLDGKEENVTTVNLKGWEARIYSL